MAVRAMGDFPSQFLPSGDCVLISIAPAQIFTWSYGLQVVRINAASNAAKVINLKPFGNWSDMQLIADAVGLGEPFRGEHSVSGWTYRSSPKPATGERFRHNEPHESLNNRRASISSRHVTSLWSQCLGLRDVTSIVAAHLYFPIFTMEAQS